MNLATSPGRDSKPELIRPGAGGGLGTPSKPSSRLVVKCKVRLTSCLKSRIVYHPLAGGNALGDRFSASMRTLCDES